VSVRTRLNVNMPKHIGIIACSAEGAALCYRTICAEGPFVLGEHMHPEISMHTHPLGAYMEAIQEGDWWEVGQLMLSSARKVTEMGARLAICPDNTIHQAFDRVVERSPIPWLHIADAVAQEARFPHWIQRASWPGRRLPKQCATTDIQVDDDNGIVERSSKPSGGGVDEQQGEAGSH
jgi:hypothetical protein